MARPHILRLSPGGFAGLLLLCGPAFADLPPPPKGSMADRPMIMKLNLELVVNQAATGHVAAIEAHGNSFFVGAQDLRSVNIGLGPEISGMVDVTTLPGITARYDESGQRLLLHIPADLLPRQAIGQKTASTRIAAETGTGALLNYNLYIANGGRQGSQFSLWNEARIFSPYGVFRSTGTYLHNFAHFGQRGYNRYDTSLTYVDDVNIRTYEAGDFITRTLPRSGAVRVAGFQLSRNFSVRPDIITHPVPDFSGTAAVPTAVDLYINGYHSMSGRLDPGPFTISDFPYVNGAGKAVVVTSDAQGRRITADIPFYVASALLRPGLSDYTFSVGFARRNYGSRAFSYGDVVANAALRHGVNNWLTVEGEARYTPSFLLGGTGAVARIGQMGVVEASATVSHYEGTSGFQTKLGYQYTGRRAGLMISHSWRSHDFADFANVIHSYRRPDSAQIIGGENWQDFSLPRREIQMNGNLVLGHRLGTIGVNYIETHRKDQRHRLAGLSYARPIGRDISLLVNANRELSSKRTTAMLQILVPLGGSSTAISGVERGSDGNLRGRAGYSRAVPLEGGIGGRAELSRSRTEGAAYRADVSIRTEAFQMQVGTFGQRGSHVQWGEISGSVVMMGGQAFATNRVNDAFILVSTDGFADVPVLQENRVIGATNHQGLLLLPHVHAYYGTKIGIDPLSLPADLTTSIVEQRAAVHMGGGKMIRFPVQQLVAAMLVLHDRNNQPLPPGTSIRVGTGPASYVGWDGVAYLEQLSRENIITATMPDGSECSAQFSLAADHRGVKRTGTLTCQ